MLKAIKTLLASAVIFVPVALSPAWAANGTVIGLQSPDISVPPYGLHLVVADSGGINRTGYFTMGSQITMAPGNYYAKFYTTDGSGNWTLYHTSSLFALASGATVTYNCRSKTSGEFLNDTNTVSIKADKAAGAPNLWAVLFSPNGAMVVNGLYMAPYTFKAPYYTSGYYLKFYTTWNYQEQYFYHQSPTFTVAQRGSYTYTCPNSSAPATTTTTTTTRATTTTTRTTTTTTRATTTTTRTTTPTTTTTIAPTGKLIVEAYHQANVTITNTGTGASAGPRTTPAVFVVAPGTYSVAYNGPDGAGTIYNVAVSLNGYRHVVLPADRRSKAVLDVNFSAGGKR